MLFSIGNSSIKINPNRKCNLNNKNGIITPEMTDDFLSNSLSTTKDRKEIPKNNENALSNENTTNKTTSNINPLNTNPLYTKKIMYDYSEVLVPCKPSLNITASKILMKEYSTSKIYQGDKIIINSSIEESRNIQNQQDNEKNEINEINKLQNVEKSNQKETEIESEFDGYEELLRYQENHLPVPLEKKDNENFKILKIKQMKRISMPPNKSVRKFAEDKEPFYEKDFRILNAFSTMKKRKPIHSTRRIYSSNYALRKKNGTYENFMIFRDKDIGIYEYWQAHIHEARNDEDVETDEEQKNVAKNFCISEIKDAFEYIRNNGNDAFMNFNRYDFLINKEKASNIMNIIENNLDNFISNKTEKRKD